MSAYLTHFLVSLSAVFFVVDPIGVVPIFLAITAGDSETKMRRTALRACIVAGGLLMFFAVFGGVIFQVFGVSLAAFRVAGGILLLITSLDMLRARPSETRLNQLDAPGTVDLERLYRIVDVLTAIGQERNVSAAQVALNWVMYKPGVDTVIIGARNEEQLRDNLAAGTWRLTNEEMARLDEVSALPEPYPYWHQHKFGLERNPRLPAVRP